MLPREISERFAQNPTLVSGRLHILNLDQLERHFGENWPKVKSRALAIAEQTIIGGLGPHDLHVKVDEAKWLFFFPTLDKQAAQIHCAMLADKVFRRLIGDDGRFDEVRVETVVVEADGQVLLQAADPAALIHALVEEKAAPAEPEQQSTANWEVDFDDDEPEPPPATEQKERTYPRWRRQEPETFPEDIRFHFVPIWDAARDIIAMHICEPMREAPGGILLTGYDTLTLGDNSTLVGMLDMAIFKRARAAARELIETNDPGFICFSVHCRTLEVADARRRLTKLLERSKPEERKLFTAQLAGLPVGAPSQRILYGVSFLRRYARAVLVQVPLAQMHFDKLIGSGASGVVCRPGFGHALTARDTKHIVRFGEQARHAGLMPLASGLHDRTAVEAAVGAGITKLSGDAIRAPTGRPHGVRPFSPPEFRAGGAGEAHLRFVGSF